MRLRAMAKINLSLDVLGLRPDGYHDVRMVMQSVSMYDVLEILPRREPGIVLETSLPSLPSDSRNLVWRAADLLIKEFQIPQGVHIRLIKQIPVEAGLAGGSTDAAAALRGINSLFGLGLSLQELMERGARLGADVPFCVMGGTALAEGIGEKLTPLPDMPSCAVLIGKPAVSVSTKEAYENLDTESLAGRPDIDRMLRFIREKDLAGTASCMQNVFEPGITAQHPVIGQIRQIMEENGALGAMMSGSGPTVFGLYETRSRAEKAARVLARSGLAKTVRVCGTAGQNR